MQENVTGQGRNENSTDQSHQRSNEVSTNNNEPQNTSSAGGTTDMDAADRSGAVNQGLGHGSDASTKRNVTGSDFDGQVSAE